MTTEHVPRIAELEKLCFFDPWSEASVLSELDNPLSLWFAAVESGTVLGYVGSQSVLDSADMMNIAVHPDHRQKGIAQKLICALTDALAEKGIRQLMLEVRISNEPAIRLYEKLGFAVAGKRPGYYRNPREDALILRKELA